MKQTLLLIAGNGRSGSTILDILLARRPLTATVGELRWLWSRGLTDPRTCSCGSAIPECPFWSEVVARVERDTGLPARVLGRRLESLLQNRSRARHLAFRPQSADSDVQEFLAAVYRHVFSLSGATVIVDSSKFFAYVSLAEFASRVPSTVIHMVRDPRAVAYSWTRRKKRPDVRGRSAYMPQYPPWKTARSWLYQQALLLRLRHRWHTYRLVRYEDFVARPSQTLEQLLDPSSTTATSSTILPCHAVDGNPVRFSGHPPRIRPDMEWVTQLPLHQKILVTAITLPLLSRFGYPVWPR